MLITNFALNPDIEAGVLWILNLDDPTVQRLGPAEEIDSSSSGVVGLPVSLLRAIVSSAGPFGIQVGFQSTKPSEGFLLKREAMASILKLAGMHDVGSVVM